MELRDLRVTFDAQVAAARPTNQIFGAKPPGPHNLTIYDQLVVHEGFVDHAPLLVSDYEPSPSFLAEILRMGVIRGVPAAVPHPVRDAQEPVAPKTFGVSNPTRGWTETRTIALPG